MSCCATPRPDCMGMLVEGIGNRCQALSACQALEFGQAGGDADQAGFEPVRNDAIRMAEIAARVDGVEGHKQLLPLRFIKDQAQGNASDLAGCANGLQNVADGGGRGVEIVGLVGGFHSAPVVEKCAAECRAGGIVSEGTASAQRLNRELPAPHCPASCRGPGSDCLGYCIPRGARS